MDGSSLCCVVDIDETSQVKPICMPCRRGTCEPRAAFISAEYSTKPVCMIPGDIEEARL